MITDQQRSLPLINCASVEVYTRQTEGDQLVDDMRGGASEYLDVNEPLHDLIYARLA